MGHRVFLNKKKKRENSFKLVQVVERRKNELGKANFLGRKFKGK